MLTSSLTVRAPFLYKTPQHYCQALRQFTHSLGFIALAIHYVNYNVCGSHVDLSRKTERLTGVKPRSEYVRRTRGREEEGKDTMN